MFIKLARLVGKLQIRHMLFKSEQKWLYQMAAVGFVLGIFSFACLLLQKAGLIFSPDLRLDKPSSICTAFGVSVRCLFAIKGEIIKGKTCF